MSEPVRRGLSRLLLITLFSLGVFLNWGMGHSRSSSVDLSQRGPAGLVEFPCSVQASEFFPNGTLESSLEVANFTIGLEKSGDAGPLLPGAALNYQLNLTNSSLGLHAAYAFNSSIFARGFGRFTNVTSVPSVSITDSLPADVLFQAISANFSVFDSRGHQWTEVSGCVAPSVGSSGTIVCSGNLMAAANTSGIAYDVLDSVFQYPHGSNETNAVGWRADIETLIAANALPGLLNNTVDITVASNVALTLNESPAFTLSANCSGSTYFLTEVISPANLSADMTVMGDGLRGAEQYLPGEAVTYSVEITNSGPALQVDAAGNEFFDLLPSTLALNCAGTFVTAGGGVLTCNGGANTVAWNGSIPAGGTVSIEIAATIDNGLAGVLVENQAALAFDADGNGISEAMANSDDPGTAPIDDPTAFTVVSPASLTATKSVAGDDSVFLPGELVTYTIDITNSGPAPQVDAADDEFFDQLPAPLQLDCSGTSIIAGDGTLGCDEALDTVTWNGAIPVDGVVTLEIAAIIDGGLDGDVVENQGVLNFDEDGDGVSEAIADTDDPMTPPETDPTGFVLGAITQIPTAGTVGLLLLGLLLVLSALPLIRK